MRDSAIQGLHRSKKKQLTQPKVAQPKLGAFRPRICHWFRYPIRYECQTAQLKSGKYMYECMYICIARCIHNGYYERIKSETCFDKKEITLFPLMYIFQTVFCWLKHLSNTVLNMWSCALLFLLFSTSSNLYPLKCFLGLIDFGMEHLEKAVLVKSSLFLFKNNRDWSGKESRTETDSTKIC